MKRAIRAKSAGVALLAIWGVLIVFHLLVLFRLLPSQVVWGGRAGGSPSDLLVLELVSLSFTVLFAVVVAAKVGYIRAGRFAKVVNVLLWILFAYLLLNAWGNLTSSSLLERWVFTPITLVAALLVFRLAIEK